jgi:hypothetical protein
VVYLKCDILLHGKPVNNETHGTSRQKHVGDGNQSREPLRAVILANTGEDIRKCSNCLHCETERTEGTSLSFEGIVHAAAQSDAIALENETLWNCDPMIERNPIYPSGLDRARVIQALREEALVRGHRRRN